HWGIAGAAGKTHLALFEAERPFGAPGGRLTVQMRFADKTQKHAVLGRFRLWATAEADPLRWPALLAAPGVGGWTKLAAAHAARGRRNGAAGPRGAGPRPGRNTPRPLPPGPGARPAGRARPGSQAPGRGAGRGGPPRRRRRAPPARRRRRDGRPGEVPRRR